MTIYRETPTSAASITVPPDTNELRRRWAIEQALKVDAIPADEVLAFAAKLLNAAQNGLSHEASHHTDGGETVQPLTDLTPRTEAMPGQPGRAQGDPNENCCNWAEHYTRQQMASFKINGGQEITSDDIALRDAMVDEGEGDEANFAAVGPGAPTFGKEEKV